VPRANSQDIMKYVYGAASIGQQGDLDQCAETYCVCNGVEPPSTAPDSALVSHSISLLTCRA
jgi:hypothetical protein